MTLHPLLLKQLARAGVEPSGLDPALTAFLTRVSQTYRDADLGRYRLERSIAISAEEMAELLHTLEAERDRLRAIFDSAAVGIAQATLDGVLLECNEAFGAMVGRRREELLGRPWLEFVHPDEREAARAGGCRALEAPATFERRYVRSDGRVIWAAVTVSTVVDASGAPATNIAVQRDITAQRELEISLPQAQKLEAVGRLAAGIAHEINTPLQFIGDNLGFLQASLAALVEVHAGMRALVPAGRAGEIDRLEQEADLAFLLDEAPRAAESSASGIEHVAHIVRAMKVLARHESSGVPVLVDLNTTLDSVVTVARSETKYVADVQVDLGDIPKVLGYADDLSQVFLNLVVNAAHAVADVVARTHDRGRIGVKSARDGDAVVVAIEDSGAGIPESIRARIFEPFFTTKAVGRGTGQGLSLARAIVVDKHGGDLSFDSVVGRGTTFRVRLPVSGPAGRAA